jgi:hypothetical protein
MSEKEPAFKKYANAELKEPTLSVPDWDKMYGTRTFGHKTASFSKFAADSSKYILSHCTIMSSVMTEADPFDYHIKPECSHLVNNNDDAWTNEVLKLSHRSFVGAFNFVEHFQNSKYAKGHILDAVLRKVQIVPEEQIWVYFCDILVATDMTHEKLVNDIREGKVRYLSMGCVTDLVICSYCGAHVTDQNTYCNHLSFQKGMFLADDDGVARRVAELCGHKTMENGGVKFVEASWVATPAFPGAAKRNIVADEWMGPKSPYTRKAALEEATNTASFAKAASEKTDFEALTVGDVLLDEDPKGHLRR